MELSGHSVGLRERMECRLLTKRSRALYKKRGVLVEPVFGQMNEIQAKFVSWCGQSGYEKAAETIERDWERMVTFYDFPKEHWQHLRTTNPVESPFAALRLRTDAAKRYKRVDRASAII